MYEISAKHSFQFILTNGIRLHALVAGNSEHPMMILLHGFPEFYMGWANQVDRLVQAGYFVIIPDQRGYHLSDKPLGVESYLVKELALDILGLMEKFKKEKAYLAGHDWGGSVAYYLAMNYPERFYKLITVNACVPETLQRKLYRSHRQRWRSLHMLWFNFPRFTHWYLSKNDYEAIGTKFLNKRKSNTFSKEVLSLYKNAWSEKGAIQAMTNWYRASFSKKNLGWSKRIDIPLLIIWGKKDEFLSNELAEASAKYAENAQIKYLEKGSHWTIHEYPEEIGRLMLVFLNERMRE